MIYVQNEEEDLDFIESRMQTFTDYISHVTHMEIRMQRLRIEGIDGQEWRDQVQDMDQTRRMKHDAAMDAINQLNRLCKANGVDLFYEGEVDHEHRTEIGDEIEKIVHEYFKDREGARTLTREDLMDDFTEAVDSIPAEDAAMEK